LQLAGEKDGYERGDRSIEREGNKEEGRGGFVVDMVQRPAQLVFVPGNASICYGLEKRGCVLRRIHARRKNREAVTCKGYKE
jgi:hypothetical protein